MNTLFDLGTPSPRIGDPEGTFDARREAYQQFSTPHLNQLEIECLKILSKESLISDEVAKKLSKDILLIRPRCSRLVEVGFVVKTQAKRRTIKSNGLEGKFAHVLQITEKGREALKLL